MKSKTVSKLLSKKLEGYYKEEGLRYTPSRKIPLEIIAASPRLIGAYAIIEKIAKNNGPTEADDRLLSH